MLSRGMVAVRAAARCARRGVWSVETFGVQARGANARGRVGAALGSRGRRLYRRARSPYRGAVRVCRTAADLVCKYLLLAGRAKKLTRG